MCRCIDSKCVFAIHQLRPGIDAKLQRSGEIAGRSLTLITCYPFYFVGSAPKRFVVPGSRTVGVASELSQALWVQLGLNVAEPLVERIRLDDAFHPSAISFVSTTPLTLVASRDHAHR